MKEKHNEGMKSVAIRCSEYDLLRKIVNHYNTMRRVTPEGFIIKVGAGGVAGLAIRQLAERLKVKL